MAERPIEDGCPAVVVANRAVRYDFSYAPEHGRWYLDASWSADTAVLPTPEVIQAFGEHTLGVDLVRRC